MASALKRLREDFPEFLADDTRANSFDGAKYAEFGRSALGALLEKAISDADAGGLDLTLRRQLRQLLFRYRDGAPMVTIGWMIISEADLATFDACNFEALPFVRIGASAFKIATPLVTPLEVREMERRLPDLAAATDLDWIPTVERTRFANVDRYLPQFSVVKQV